MLARLVRFLVVVALFAWAFGGCSGSDASLATLSIASADSLTPAPGQTVTLTVRAVMTDGTSIDVSDRVECHLTAQNPPGALAGLVFTAARSGTTDVACAFNGKTGTIGITVPGALRVTAAQIQRGTIDPNTKIEVSAIVFALDPDGKYTNFWAQDPGAGPYSGIYFRDVRKLAVDAGAPDADAGVEARPVAEGDVVTVTGTYIERLGRSVVSWESLAKTGSDMPKPDVVALAMVDPATWDGCFIETRDVVVTNAAVDAYTWQIGDAASPGGATLLVETLLYAVRPTMGDHFAAIRGPLYVQNIGDAGAREVAMTPRRAEDLQR